MARIFLILIIIICSCKSSNKSVVVVEDLVHVGINYHEMVEATFNYPNFKHHFVSYNGSQTIRFENPLLELGIDSVYFMHVNENKLEMLVKTMNSNPVWFIEVDSTGSYTTNYYFGENIFDLGYIYQKDSIVYDFDIKQPIMLDNYYWGNCKITSSIHDVGSTVVCYEK